MYLKDIDRGGANGRCVRRGVSSVGGDLFHLLV